MSREIVLDTETTGLNPLTGDRIVEIGAIELYNHIPTGKHFHHYLNPERRMSEDAFRVHGLSDDFLADKPRFAEIADEMLAFFGDAPLIAHNALFDINFINYELEQARRAALTNIVIDTVTLAKERHPGARVSLDALCKHYGIDNSRRTLHGALLDSEILADVYLELIGGRQVTLALVEETTIVVSGAAFAAPIAAPQRPTPLPSRLDTAQLAAHLALVKSLGKDALWSDYRDEAA
ncbi:MAG TPA: DNA polymerase III subunit epsilon [Devosia sp.]|jgi:DNA polymerase-3 subunit epsilon|nr:DNA polymerase III subunit epsilon [Devosia sp.]